MLRFGAPISDGDDVIFEGAHNDTIKCGNGTDTADGGSGTDTAHADCETQINIP